MKSTSSGIIFAVQYFSQELQISSSGLLDEIMESYVFVKRSCKVNRDICCVFTCFIIVEYVY